MKFEFSNPVLRQKAAQLAAFDDAASSVPQPEESSKILKDILSGLVDAKPVAKRGASEPSQPPLSYRLSVGARLGDANRRALESAARLIALADVETARTMSLVVHRLRNQACKVAFLGQVKAGKSSLINVLVEQPNLLPADINPCTAAVTRLNFAVPGKPQSGALLKFFSREEWHRLSLGGRTRELTNRLFPDFNWDVLRSQVKTMELRAREKLGASLEDLLGKEHVYEDVRTALLVRYVGVGYLNGASPSERAEGEFSDITKSADIFFDLGAFSFPTILIDTPGVNDPFLVRDEITRQNLEVADICVVVVTARHPLSATDLNLLRMLRGLKKDRLIIFINRIDEVNGGADVLDKLKQRVSNNLKQEFPSARIPIVFGSAALALEALAGPASGGDSDAGALDEVVIGFQSPSREDIAEKSGLLSLADAISEMMSVCSIADTINASTRLIDSVSRNLIAWLEIEANILGRISVDAERAEKEFGAIANLRKGLAAKFDVFRERLAFFHAQEVHLLKQKLSSTVNAFIPEALSSLLDDNTAMRASQMEVKLRMRLETAFLEAIEKIRNLLENEQKMLRSELSKLLEASGVIGKPAIVLGQSLSLTPSLAALSEPSALGVAPHLKELTGELIIADFAAIVEELTSEASRVFQQACSIFVEQAKPLTLGPIDATIERISLALTEAQTRPPGDAKTRVQAIHETISDLGLILEPIGAILEAGANQAALKFGVSGPELPDAAWIG